MAYRLFALSLIAVGLHAQTFSWTFRQTPQSDGTILTELYEGNAPPPQTIVQPLLTTWGETCIEQPTETYKVVTLTWATGMPSFSVEDVTPGGSNMSVQITPLTPPAGFVVAGIVIDEPGQPMMIYGDAQKAAADAAAWVVSSWAAIGQPCRTIRMRWLGAKAYARMDMTPNEWHIAPAHWPVTATITTGP